MTQDTLIEDRTFKFALRFVKAYKYLREQKNEYVLSKQMLRSGTSIGAMMREAIFAQSRADFVSKTSIALKEANETKYWLVLLHESETISDDEFHSIENDINTIIGTLIIIIKKKKGLV